MDNIVTILFCEVEKALDTNIWKLITLFNQALENINDKLAKIFPKNKCLELKLQKNFKPFNICQFEGE